jgi:hypothetical protein
MNFRKIIFATIAFGYFVKSFSVFAEKTPTENEEIGVVVNVVGQVTLQHQGQKLILRKGDLIFEGDSFATGNNGAIKINFNDGSNFMAFKDTEFKVLEYKIVQTKKGGINLNSVIQTFKGDFRAYVKPKVNGVNNSKFVAANNVLSVRGTEIAQSVKNNLFQAVVFSGTVDCQNSHQTLTINSGELIQNTSNQAQPLKVEVATSQITESFNQARKQFEQMAAIPNINSSSIERESLSSGERSQELNEQSGFRDKPDQTSQWRVKHSNSQSNGHNENVKQTQLNYNVQVDYEDIIDSETDAAKQNILRGAEIKIMINPVLKL